MPIYEYYCENCGASFEDIRSIQNADAPIPCGTCQSTRIKRKLSLVITHSVHDGQRKISRSQQGCSARTCSSCTGCNR